MTEFENCWGIHTGEGLDQTPGNYPEENMQQTLTYPDFLVGFI